MRLLKDLIQSSSLPNQPKQLVVPNVVSLPSSVFDATQSNQSENFITQPTFPIEVVQPKTMNLNVLPKARDSFNKSSQSPIKQLIEEESIKVKWTPKTGRQFKWDTVARNGENHDRYKKAQRSPAGVQSQGGA